MSPSGSRRMEQQDRRDGMILDMAQHAARVKVKAREARHKKLRQSGYRRVRYQRFRGRREDAMEEETQEAYRARLRRSLTFMASWLDAQAVVNLQEGQPRSVVESAQGKLPVAGAAQSLITSFFRVAVPVGEE
mmetsp:Transcript_52681/g.120197  ORF Transcript_52681/g.120197 Transcript_52681/m.120197 type:complete len:133 (+) Transcript_52681:111-509(+)